MEMEGARAVVVSVFLLMLVWAGHSFTAIDEQLAVSVIYCDQKTIRIFGVYMPELATQILRLSAFTVSWTCI